MPDPRAVPLNFRDEDLVSGLEASLSHVIGVFATNGTLLTGNAGMKRLLATKHGEVSLDNLINPTWQQLVEAGKADTVIYDGLFTFNVNSKSYESLKGIARRKHDQILLIAEYDVVEMARVQVDLVSLNSEVTNLQRELAIKNSQLDRTLTQLKDTQVMLIHSEKMNAMGQLVAGVAHEVNNPISFITSNFHTLSGMARDLVGAYSRLEREVDESHIDALKTAAAQIREEADLDFVVEDLDDLLKSSLDGLSRVTKLVTELRNFARLDEAETKLANVRAGLVSSLSLARPALSNRVTVALDIADDLPDIQCRPAELNQVFLNLIMNAAQAIEGEGNLRIKATHDSAFIMIEFADDGIGMTPEIQKDIFNPFFTTKPVGSGTGLGLSIAHKIVVDGHGGTISVQSQVGQGSIFLIRLPIVT